MALTATQPKRIGGALNWTAFPKQAIFLGTFAEVDEALFGGAAGPGKSEGLIMYFAKRRLEHPGSKGLFLRRTFKQLVKEGGAISESHRLLSGVAEWYATDKKWIFPNGSVEEFGHCQEENDKYDYQSAQYADICFDELTQFTKSIYTYIGLSRVRSITPGLKPQLRSASNPGGIGHTWVKKRFIDAMRPYEICTETVRNPITGEMSKRNRVFIPANLRDNPALMKIDPDYALRLDALDANERRALLEGRWDLFEGQALAWDTSLHVIRPFQVPVEWPRWYTVDYGYEAPWCCLWLTKNLDLWVSDRIARYYCYREQYGPGVPAWQQAMTIKKLNGDERIQYGVADASMWQGYDAGTSLIGYYERHGLFPRKAPSGTGARVPAKGHVDWLLSKVQDGLPRLQFMANCRNAIKTLPNLQYDKHRPEDIDTEGEDHAFDALKGWAAGIVGNYQRYEPQEYRIYA